MTRTALATLPKNKAASARGASARAFDLQSLVSLAEPRMVAVRCLADDLIGKQLPDNPDQYPDLLESLPPQTQLSDAVDMLRHALSQPATPDEMVAMIALLLDGLGHKVGPATKAKIAAMMIALMPADVLIADEQSTETISAMVLACTIARMFRRAKQPPLPSELLAACIATRTAVENLLEYLQEVEQFSVHMRTELRYLIASNDPAYDHALDDHQRIPLW
jgi:hypothetical protein